jgi:pimeloyl-ACP methyl ester carboxylesterase
VSVQFTLTSTEGLPIRGNLDVPANARALVVAIHGFKGFKDWGFFPWLAHFLTEERFAVCRFNMSRSGVGESLDTFEHLDLFADDTFTTQLADLRMVVDHAQKRADLPTFLFGHSRGGGVALLGAHAVPQLHGVVTWNSIAHADRWDDETKKRWRRDGRLEVENSRTKQMMPMSTRMLDDVALHDIVGAASRLTVPLLAIHGGSDESVPPSETEELAAAASDAVHVVIRSATHTMNAVHPMGEVPRALDLAAAVTCRFLAAYVE